MTHSVAFVAVFPLPDETKFPAPKEDPISRYSRSTLFPGASTSIDAVGVEALNAEEIAALKEKIPKAAIYVAGEAHYRDIFGRKRISEYCSYIIPEDTKKLIAAEEQNLALDAEVRFSQAHILNHAT